jgi:hypothetical protein
MRLKLHPSPVYSHGNSLPIKGPNKTTGVAGVLLQGVKQ